MKIGNYFGITCGKCLENNLKLKFMAECEKVVCVYSKIKIFHKKLAQFEKAIYNSIRIPNM